MTITVSGPDVLARQAAAQGLSVESYVERLAQQAAQSAEPHQQVWRSPDRRTAEEVVTHLRQARKGVTLGGLKIKDLIHEGHKY